MNKTYILALDQGTTSSRAIINALRKGGARKISLVITYPPIKFPCFAGIDFPSQEELATYTDGKDYSDVQLVEKVQVLT